MTGKNGSAPDLTEAPTPTGAETCSLPEADYTASQLGVEEAREAFEKYLKILPANLRKDYRAFDQRKIVEALGGDHGDPTLEALLPRLKTIDSAILLQREFPPVPWIVQDYLPPGLTILSGRPKVGKSWLALQLALAVLTGGKIFDKDIQSGRVLYLALEDSERRLKDRMKMQQWPIQPGGIEFMFSDVFTDQIGYLNSGGGKRLLKYIENNKYRLVIVDTFSRAIRGDQLDSSEMTEAIGPLQHQAIKMDYGLVFIDHMRKNVSAIVSPVDEIFGSTAKAGVMDTAWALYKEPRKQGAKLGIIGRDVNEYTLKLDFDQQGYYWHCEGNAFEIEITEKRKQILQVLEEVESASLTEIADALGEQHTGNTYNRLSDLYNAGLVKRRGKNYFLA